jgi:hypothetical protein
MMFERKITFFLTGVISWNLPPMNMEGHEKKISVYVSNLQSILGRP